MTSCMLLEERLGSNQIELNSKIIIPEEKYSTKLYNAQDSVKIVETGDDGEQLTEELDMKYDGEEDGGR